MKTEQKKTSKKDFEKDFFKLMNNAFFGKTMEYVRKNRDIKLTVEARRNYLVPERNYHTTKNLSDLLAIGMKRAQTLMKKPAYSGLPILEIIKIVMRAFWYHQ